MPLKKLCEENYDAELQQQKEQALCIHFSTLSYSEEYTLPASKL